MNYRHVLTMADHLRMSKSTYCWDEKQQTYTNNPNSKFNSFFKTFLSMMEKAVCFNISNVARMVNTRAEENDKGIAEIDVYDLPCVKPPFPYTWMEYDMPPMDGKKDKFIKKIGVLLISEEYEVGSRFAGTTFMLNVSDRIIGPICGVDLNLDEHGKCNYRQESIMAPGGHQSYSMFVLPVYQALALLHCKNVAAPEKDPPTTINERHRRDHPPLVRYRTLVIRPVGKRFSQAAPPGTTGSSETPYTICRGHLKTFDEKPLFGKVRGMFWWGDHARGDRKHGEVIKDYDIRPSKGDSHDGASGTAGSAESSSQHAPHPHDDDAHKLAQEGQEHRPPDGSSQGNS